MQDSNGKLSVPEFIPGLPLASANIPAARVTEFLELPGYRAVELPSELLDLQTSLVDQYLTDGRFAYRFCGGILDRELGEQLPMMPPALRQEFVEQSDLMLQKAARKKILTASLDLDLSLILDTPGADEIMLQVLRKLAPTLIRLNMTLLLPFRIPSPDPDLIPAVLHFLRNCMVPNIKLRLMIHPHELKPDFQAQKLTGHLLLETRALFFRYNLETGNKLLAAHLRPWAELVRQTKRTIPFFPTPITSDPAAAFPEFENLPGALTQKSV